MADDNETLDFKVGGFCALTEDAATKGTGTPGKLRKIGWPNKFLIVEVFEDKEGEKFLRFDPCCGWMEDLKDPKKDACVAHPAKFFTPLSGHIADDIAQETEEAEEAPVGPAGGRYTGLNLGEGEEDMVGVEFLNGTKAKKFFLRRAGKPPIVISGVGAQRMMKFIDGLGIL